MLLRSLKQTSVAALACLAVFGLTSCATSARSLASAQSDFVDKACIPSLAGAAPSSAQASSTCRCMSARLQRRDHYGIKLYDAATRAYRSKTQVFPRAVAAALGDCFKPVP